MLFFALGFRSDLKEAPETMARRGRLTYLGARSSSSPPMLAVLVVLAASALSDAAPRSSSSLSGNDDRSSADVDDLKGLLAQSDTREVRLTDTMQSAQRDEDMKKEIFAHVAAEKKEKEDIRRNMGTCQCVSSPRPYCRLT